MRLWGNRKASQSGWASIFKSEEHTMDYPYYITTDHHDRIITTDYSRQEVQIFDVSGKLLRRFGDSHVLGKPAGLAVDSRNNIVVAHTMYDTEMVTVFSPDGLMINNPLEGQSRTWGAARSLVISDQQMCLITETQCMLFHNQYETYHPASS